MVIGLLVNLVKEGEKGFSFDGKGVILFQTPFLRRETKSYKNWPFRCPKVREIIAKRHFSIEFLLSPECLLFRGEIDCNLNLAFSLQGGLRGECLG